MTTVGEGLKAFNWFTKLFSREEKHERVEEGLISTGDELHPLALKVSRKLKLVGKKKLKILGISYEDVKLMYHYSRKWKADRKALK